MKNKKPDKARVLYVPTDGGHVHTTAVNTGEHQHIGLEWEIQALIVEQHKMWGIIQTLEDQLAICHVRIDELELELDE